MKADNLAQIRSDRVWLSKSRCDIDEFRAVVERTNDRIWNALEKFCLRDPAAFAAYYGNDIIALVSEAWLGPSYQVTSQVNCVNPGGAAQSAHRDYHLGFQSPEVIERYPVHVHRI